MASIVDIFPRRPLKLAADPGRRNRRILLLAITVLLALPALYWGSIAWRSAQLRSDLRARGVEAAETIGTEGDCYSRRNRLSGAERPIDCWLTLTYRLRPEEGGAVRTAPVHLEGRAPIFTPRAFYDPQNPDRVMLQPEMDREMTWSESIGPLSLLLLPAATLLVFFFTSRRGLAKAAQNPDPLIVPVEKLHRQMPANKLYVHFQPPGAARPLCDVFPGGASPLLVPPPLGAHPDQQWVLALKARNGRPYLLDSALAYLDLTDDERARVLSAARGY